jgi:hypothetical protein
MVEFNRWIAISTFIQWGKAETNCRVPRVVVDWLPLGSIIEWAAQPQIWSERNCSFSNNLGLLVDLIEEQFFPTRLVGYLTSSMLTIANMFIAIYLRTVRGHTSDSFKKNFVWTMRWLFRARYWFFFLRRWVSATTVMWCPEISDIAIHLRTLKCTWTIHTNE